MCIKCFQNKTKCKIASLRKVASTNAINQPKKKPNIKFYYGNNFYEDKQDSFRIVQVYANLQDSLGILLQNKIYSMRGKHGYFL